MTETVPDVLARIVAHKRERPAPEASVCRQWERQAEQARAGRRNFRQALAAHPPAIIAEIKKASPSKGLLAPDFDPVRLALAYEAGGAAALSVLTDQKFFQGSLADLAAARAACGLPVLRKDFTLDEYDVTEAAAGGADAILLIAAILDANQMRSLAGIAAGYGLAAIVEVHDEKDLAKALDADAAGAPIIGVNNRNLATFEVTLETSLRLARRIPADVVKVSESGISSAQDIARLYAAGYQGFLVGEHLMKSDDPAGAVRALIAPWMAA
ncbi:MAG TPA: indole-3-glycerol phosphate synthase TrpC [Bryobacteraceae bacterium]|nr:indole-3-glycerol phosphate synthase TrpC [Bryobacteraceae bacterium]